MFFSTHKNNTFPQKLYAVNKLFYIGFLKWDNDTRSTTNNSEENESG